MARDFNGSTDRIDYDSVLDPKGENITVGAWVYPDSLAADYILCIHNTGDSAYGLLVNLWDNGLEILRNWSAGDAVRNRWDTTPSVPTTGEWQHMCVTTDSGGGDQGMECYVDGVIPNYIDTSPDGGTEDAHAGKWSVGARYFDNNRNLNGRIAEVGVWDRILSADELTALVKGYSPLFLRNGLIFYAPLIRDPNDLLGKSATLDGTTVIEHPPGIIYPS